MRKLFSQRYKAGEFVTDKTGAKVIELVGASFLADEPVIFGKENGEYIKRELLWYKSMSLNVKDIPGEVPKIWTEVASEDGEINSNYGWCVWSKENEYQYSHVLMELSLRPDSRRAVMIYTRPSMQRDYKRNGMSDFMCTNAVQYMIRDAQLHTIVQMRSNDAVFGYKNDLAWQVSVRNELLRDLRNTHNITVGDIIWQVGSLHLYERHFKYLV